MVEIILLKIKNVFAKYGLQFTQYLQNKSAVGSLDGLRTN